MVVVKLALLLVVTGAVSFVAGVALAVAIVAGPLAGAAAALIVAGLLAAVGGFVVDPDKLRGAADRTRR